MKKKILNIVRYIRALVIKRKKLSIVLLLLILGGGYYAYGKLNTTTAETRYVLAKAEKGTFITSVSGTGQVSALNQVDIKPKVSGDVTWVGVKNGEEVRAGQALFGLDDTTAKKNVFDAEITLQEAKLQLQKDTAQAPIDYQRKLETLDSQKSDLEKEYDNAFNVMSDAFLSLPATMTGAENVLYGTNLSRNSSQWNVSMYRDMFTTESDRDTVKQFADIAERDYKNARSRYDSAFLKFKSVTRDSDRTTIENMVSDTYETAVAIAQALKSEKNLIDTVIDIAQTNKQTIDSFVFATQSNLTGYLNTANSKVGALLTEERSLSDAKQAILNTQRDIDILKINNPTGSDPISLQSSRNSITKQEQTLADLRVELAKYTVSAPFAGIISKVNVEKGDSASSGTVLATILTKKKLAEITLNEVDVAKIEIEQKATVTFDAIDGLGITGEVSEIDSAGTVTQGVVNYKVKIGFDTQDDRVKAGMSISASVITSGRTDVLMIPNSAVKSQNGSYYVETVDATALNNQTSQSAQGTVLAVAPKQKAVEIGGSNDTSTEIVGGLAEGDVVVVRTIVPSSTTQTQTTQQTGVRIPGIGGGFGR